MAKIIPIRDLKDTTKVSDMCHESDKPIYITKNGYSDAVIMSNETFEKQIGRVEDYYKGLLSAMKSNAVMKELEKLSPEDTLEGLLNSKTPGEAFFYEMLGNMLMQIKQRKVVAKGNLY